MIKAKKSPVVFWNSKWIDTGKVEIYSDVNGEKRTRPKRKLVGKENKHWKPRLKRH